MAKVQWADAIKTVSGALVKINKKSPHAGDQKMVLATHRTAPTTSTDCSRLYLRGLDAITRTTPPTTDEMWVRNRFAAVAASVSARAKDVTKISADNMAFLAQKNQPGGKSTKKSYLWSLELASYDNEHPRS